MSPTTTPRFKTEKAFSTWLFKNYLQPMPFSWWYKPPTMARRGIPDWLGCVGGKFVALELKLCGARIDVSRETLQQYECDRIAEAGGFSYSRVTPENFLIVLAGIQPRMT